MSLLKALTAEEEAGEAALLAPQGHSGSKSIPCKSTQAVSKYWLQFQELKSDTTESTGVK